MKQVAPTRLDDIPAGPFLLSNDKESPMSITAERKA
ncbi:MAG: hypothetical protein H6R00_5094, partial [Proteobacteria bacterium]|nr:hypothetical protein [Pseudomonadota bacterium]